MDGALSSNRLSALAKVPPRPMRSYANEFVFAFHSIMRTNGGTSRDSEESSMVRVCTVHVCYTVRGIIGLGVAVIAAVNWNFPRELEEIARS